MSVQAGHSSLVADGRLRFDLDTLARPKPADEPFALGPQRLAPLGHAKSTIEAPCVGEKTCPRCRETKHVLAFAGNPRYADGLCWVCRDCDVEGSRISALKKFWHDSDEPRNESVKIHARHQRGQVLVLAPWGYE